MEFTVASARKNEFIENIAKLCKKFKLESYELIWTEEYKLYTVTPSIEGAGDYDVMGYTATLVVEDFDKFTNTGFTYLGSIKTELGAVFTTPSRYAVEKEIVLSDLKEEIESFPCNECNKKIARNIIHVFEEDATGNVTVYGSGCALKRFGVDLASALRKFSALTERIESEGYGRMADSYQSASYWSRIAYYFITEHGYVSRSKAYNEEWTTSTDQETFEMYNILSGYGDSRYDVEMRQVMPEKLEAMIFDFDAFKKWAVVWVDSLENNDFKFNLNTALEVMVDGYILPKLSGYIAYMVFKYWFDNVKVQEPKVEYNTDYSDMEIKERLRDIKMIVTDERSFEGNFGTTHVYTFLGVDTNIKYKWFASKGIDTEGEMMVTGTVKSFQDDAKWGKAVVLTRCIVKEVV